jgi:hypothetical protein
MVASRWPWRLPLARVDQAFDLKLGKVFAIAAHIAVAAPPKRDCP